MTSEVNKIPEAPGSQSPTDAAVGTGPSNRPESKEVCHRCGAAGPNVARRHQDTAYVDDESNYDTLCEPCQKQADIDWDTQWREAGLR